MTNQRKEQILFLIGMWSSAFAVLFNILGIFINNPLLFVMAFACTASGIISLLTGIHCLKR